MSDRYLIFDSYNELVLNRFFCQKIKNNYSELHSYILYPVFYKERVCDDYGTINELN